MTIDLNAVLAQVLVALLSLAAAALAGFVNELRKKAKAEHIDDKLAILFKFVESFVHAAEQLMYNQVLTPDQRKAWVMTRLAEVAKKIGLKVDEQLLSIISGMIEATVAKSG